MSNYFLWLGMRAEQLGARPTMNGIQVYVYVGRVAAIDEEEREARISMG
jgi:hypothetical protein